MNCSQWRHRFAELWEGELSAETATDANEHISLCAECREAYAQFEEAQATLHALAPERPPVDLEARVLTALGTGATPPVRRSGVALLAAAAALLLVGGAIGYSLQRLGEASNPAEALRAREEGLAQLNATVEGLSQKHQGELTMLRAELQEVREDSGRQVSAALAQRDAALANSRQAVQREAIEVDRALDCAHSLRVVQSRVLALEEHLADLHAASAPPQVPPPNIAAAATDADPVGSAPERPAASPTEFSPAGRNANVIFRQRDGKYEAVVRGARSDVIPKLLAFARDRDDREISILALGTLENLLGAEIAAVEEAAALGGARPATDKRPGVLRRWRDRVRLAERPQDRGPSRVVSEYERRLRDVEIAWTRVTAGASFPSHQVQQ